MDTSYRVLITGGLGFIGSHLTRALAKEGFEVVVFDNTSRGLIGHVADVRDEIDVVVGDIRDEHLVDKAVSKADVVIHLAALTDVRESIERPDLYFEVNVRGTYNVVKSCRRAFKVIFASSCAVYGEPIRLPISEDHPLNPKSPYAASKIAGEAYVMTFASLYGYKPVIFRLFNVYGPRQSKGYAGVIAEFIRRALSGGPLVIYGDGEQTRDFIFIDDVVNAFKNAIMREVEGVFNIGSGRGVKIVELANIVIRVLGVKTDVIYAPPRIGEIRHSTADISKAKALLGFEPRVGLEEGIRITAEFYRRHWL